MNKFRNLVPLQGFSIFHNYYAYIDMSDYYKADLVFIENGLRHIKFIEDCV